MSQAWATLSKACILFSICLIVSACNGSYTAFEDDADFDTDAKTLDIELENTEEVILAVLQAAFTTHYTSALYDFLDASDIPPSNDGPLYDPVTRLYSQTLDCRVDGVPSGDVTVSFSRPQGEEHKAGDRISLSFHDCERAGGISNGTFTGRYTKVKGLNNAFVGTDTETCLANLMDELDLNENHVIYVSGDDIKFREVADRLEADVVDYVFTEVNGSTVRTDLVLETHLIPKADKAILVNMLLDPPVNAVTSVDGDQIYSVEKLISTKHACQNYERTLNVTLNEFSTQSGDLKTVLNGSLTLFEAKDTPARINQEIINSNFKTRVEQGNLKQNFTMSNYRVQRALRFDNRSYSYLFQGLVNSPALGGTAEITNLGKLFGNFDDAYPSSGSLEIKGRGLERILLRVDQQNLELQIDVNGDSTGNGFSDFDARVDTRWADLYARDFQF